MLRTLAALAAFGLLFTLGDPPPAAATDRPIALAAADGAYVSAQQRRSARQRQTARRAAARRPAAQTRTSRARTAHTRAARATTTRAGASRRAAAPASSRRPPRRIDYPAYSNAYPPPRYQARNARIYDEPAVVVYYYGYRGPFWSPYEAKHPPFYRLSWGPGPVWDHFRP